MKLAQTEVYEVATFYHHFDVVKEGDAAPAALTVRVCDGLSCEMAGARDLLQRLPKILGTAVRVMAAPCIGRCEQAPAVAVGQRAVAHATCESVHESVQAAASYLDALIGPDDGRQLRQAFLESGDAAIAYLEERTDVAFDGVRA